MNYTRGDEIMVVIDRDGLGMDEAIGHLPDDTMVVIAGAGGKIGEAVQATVMSVERNLLGSSLRANAKV